MHGESGQINIMSKQVDFKVNSGNNVMDFSVKEIEEASYRRKPSRNMDRATSELQRESFSSK